MHHKLFFAVLASNVFFVYGTVNICLNYNKNLQVESSLNDPDIWFVPHFEANFSHPAISADIIFDNLTISITSREHQGFLEHGALVNFTYPNISLRGEYDMFGNIGELFDIFGKGPFWLNLMNFSVAVFPELYVNASSLCVPVRIDLFLQKCEVEFSHFMEDEPTGDLVNKAFSSMIPNIIKHIWDDLKIWNDRSIEKWINEKINGDPATRELVGKKMENIISGV